MRRGIREFWPSDLKRIRRPWAVFLVQERIREREGEQGGSGVGVAHRREEW
jgi:hypothetical protein